jgi:trans-aconitate methyltransferase
MLQTIKRAIRHVTIERSYERYYSSNGWDKDWSNGYALDKPKEDARYGCLIALMRRYERSGPILDVGCGDGLLEEWYRQVSETRVIAFDYSAAAIEKAKDRGVRDAEFFCADSRTFTSPERYPLIVFNESLCYLDDFRDAMERYSGMLTTGGVFLISLFDTLVTRRIWRGLAHAYEQADQVTVRHGSTGCVWNIRVMRPRI